VRTAEEGRAALEYFNAFHDGFVKDLSIHSHDVFERRGVQTCLGLLDVEFLIAHYNYQQDTRPHDQLVRATFHEVTDLAITVSGLPYEWSIQYMAIAPATRCLDGIQVRRTPCLELILVQSRLNASREWDLHEDVRFRFDRAEFEELQAS
jgi:hypothetical protein